MKNDKSHYESMKTSEETEKGFTNVDPTIQTIDPVLARSWTSKLDPNLLMSMVSIPGTHNSGSAHTPCWSQFSARNQSLTIKAQLDAGVRYLQIRVRYRKGWDKQNMVLFHGPIDFDLTFLEALEQIKAFMQENPKETLILFFQGDDQKNSEGVIQDPSEAILEVLRSELGEDKLMMTKNVPTVGQARGKAWIWGGSWLTFADRSFMIYYDPRVGNFDYPDSQVNKYYIQGLYQICKDLTVEDKANRVGSACFCLEAEPNRIKIVGLAACGSSCISFFVHRPIAVAQNPLGPNAKLCAELKNPQRCKAKIGICIGDFLGPLLIHRIIKSNGIS